MRDIMKRRWEEARVVTILLEEGQKLPEGYDVTIQPLNLEKLFVSLCGMEE